MVENFDKVPILDIWTFKSTNTVLVDNLFNKSFKPATDFCHALTGNFSGRFEFAVK